MYINGLGHLKFLSGTFFLEGNLWADNSVDLWELSASCKISASEATRKLSESKLST
jgi:hypothetical protein